MRRFAGAVGCAALAFFAALGIAVHAHAIGTTLVSVVFDGSRSYQIDIVTDATALAEKLEASSGRSLAPNMRSAELQSLIAGADSVFRRRFSLMFDDAETRPAIAYSVQPAPDGSSSFTAAIHLAGEVPPAARRFSWKYAWTFASYAMTVRNASSAEPATEWLEGGQTSTPIALAAPPPRLDRLQIAWRYLVLGFTHIVPKGFDHVLFVL